MEEKYVRPKEIYQRVRCMKCNQRINLELNQREAYCPNCGEGWIITWVTPDMPMVLRRIQPHYIPTIE